MSLGIVRGCGPCDTARSIVRALRDLGTGRQRLAGRLPGHDDAGGHGLVELRRDTADGEPGRGDQLLGRGLVLADQIGELGRERPLGHEEDDGGPALQTAGRRDPAG